MPLKVAWNELYRHPLPDNHRFPMLKYELLPEQLLYEGTLESTNFFSPTPVSEELILQVHASTYWNRLKNLKLDRKEQRATGFPHSRELIERETTIMGGTVQCAEYAMKHGVSMNIAGGTHHSFTDRGEGFCLLNDQALAAVHLLNSKKAERILIVDLDVHQGNGTAEVFQNDSRVFTFSMHGENNYPLRKEVSDLDIPLPDGISDAAYLRLLTENLPQVCKQFKPDFMFYQCGVDILASDKLGRLGVSVDGCKKRDEFVFQKALELEIPVVCSMGGGYSEDIKVIVDAHANTFRVAQDLFF
ncbi:MAG: histone deacetylase [Flavobacteriales bacterium]